MTIKLGFMFVVCLFVSHVSTGFADDVTSATRDLVTRFCADCHGSPDDSPERGFAIGEYLASKPVDEAGPLWKKAVDAMEGFEMPPADADQPSAEQRRALVTGIREWLKAAQRPGSPVLRRLTRLEYNNTVRDLLGLDTDVLMFSERLPFDKAYFDAAAGKLPDQIRVTAREYGARYPVLLPAASLPADSRAEHGFSNRGDAQNFSAVHLEQYVQLAEQIAMHPDLLTNSRRLQEVFPTARFQQPAREAPPQKGTPLVIASGKLATNDNVMLEAEGNPISLSVFRERLQQAFQEDRGGVYDVSNNANSVISGKGAVLQLAYGKNANRIIELNPSEDIWNAAFATVDESSGGALFTNKLKGKKTFFFGIKTIGSSKVGVVEIGVVVLSRKGQQGDVLITAAFANGESQSRRVRLNEGAGTGNTFVSFQSPGGQRITKLHVDGSAFSGDYVLLDDLAFITNDSPSTPDMLVGVEPPAEEAETIPVAAQSEPQLDLSIAKRPPRQRLAHFMQRAFRRPVETGEVDLYFQLYTSEIEQGHNDELALRRAIHGVLSSPQFLYVNLQPNGSSDDIQPLTDHQLATRLSYFLWSSMPDDELRRLADAGQLHDATVLEAQTLRMLKDPRVRELSENFFVEWLRLRELWSAQPDAKLFRDFYEGPKGKRTLAQEMFCEALLLFETILVEDRSVLKLVHADETWLNGRLAKLYGIDKVTTDDPIWRRTKLDDARRGGVLTMGATLTLTSFPHRTSPIRRGAWFLETVFNRPPPPPTIAVADIDQQKDLEAGLTLREKVERHRANAACAVCHARIDPPGFALENFDAIGRWRETDGEEAIDPSGNLNGVGSFDGLAEFKQQVLAEKVRFVRGFVEQLLSYALARKLEYYDAAAVDKIVQQAARDDFRLSQIIVSIATSSAFMNTSHGSIQ